MGAPSLLGFITHFGLASYTQFFHPLRPGHPHFEAQPPALTRSPNDSLELRRRICDTGSPVNTAGKYEIDDGPDRDGRAAGRNRNTLRQRPRTASRPAGKHPSIVATLALALLMAAPHTLRASQAEGRSAYLRYCAACHGEDATGHGPLRGAFRTPPTDLTMLTKQQQTFPREKLFTVMEQSRPVAAHGSPATPVWGESFWRVAGESDFDRSPQSRTMKEIVDFLEELQAPAPVSNR
jgi:hypothetical protein